MDEEHLEEKLILLDQLQSACTGCGLCSEGCATFQQSGWEHESPRGRIQLAARFLNGHIHPLSAQLSTFDRCLGCQACEPLCPHQVSYGQVRELVQELRGQLIVDHSPSLDKKKDYKAWINLAYRVSHRLWRQYGAKWLKFPKKLLDYQCKGSFTKKTKQCLTGKPILAVCCVQDLFEHDLIEQTLQFMNRIGCPLEIDKRQPCCGAIFERLIHGGFETVSCLKEKEKAISFQNKTLKSFLKWLPSQSLFLAKGCESFVNKHTQNQTDLYALIKSMMQSKNLKLYFSEQQTVYYQPYCRSKKETKQDFIWQLLTQVENLFVQLIFNPLACCGGFGGEALINPEQAQTMASTKIETIPDGSTVVLTSPDCWILFNHYQKSKKLTLLYPIQLLAKALTIRFN